MRVNRSVLALIAGATLAGSRPAIAQEYAPASTARVGADTVISADGLFEHDETSGGLTIDMLGGWKVASRLDVLARPVV